MRIRRLVFAFLVASLANAAQPLRVLFIGNSYTYFNNCPEIFAELATAAAPGRQIEVGRVALPGQTLLALWERSNSRDVLHGSKWDYVVLQDQSQLGDSLRDGKFVVNAPWLLHWGVRMFDAEIKRQGGRTVLFLTWARKAEPDQQGDLNSGYDSIARELGAMLAPVGPAWQKVRADYPNLELYASDGSHPSPSGSYLAATVLVNSILGGANRTPPTRVTGHPIDGGGTMDGRGQATLVSLASEEAEHLQAAARWAVEQVRAGGGSLHSPKPAAIPAPPPARPLQAGEAFAGQWTGTLTYYPSPTSLELAIRSAENGKCEGSAVINIPDRQQRYETSLAQCSTEGNRVTFSVVTLPVPYLVDQFTGQVAGKSLSGTVERTGRELTNRMTGTWSLNLVSK
jgi:hypothetical protein